MNDRLSKVSVVIPCCNDAAYLGRALRNVLSQTRQPDEVIVVDDGSTDASGSIAKRHPIVRYVYQSNQGPAAARNRGINESLGDVIAFLDVDDLWAPDNLERGMDVFARDSSVEIVQSLIQDVADTDSPAECDEVCLRAQSGPYQFVNLGSLLVARSVFFKVGTFDPTLRVNEDTDWFLRTWEHDCHKVVRNRVGLYYVIREGSVTAGSASTNSVLPGLLKKHRDRMTNRDTPEVPVHNLARYFGGFPDRSDRFPRPEHVTVPLRRTIAKKQGI